MQREEERQEQCHRDILISLDTVQYTRKADRKRDGMQRGVETVTACHSAGHAFSLTNYSGFDLCWVLGELG